MSEMERYDNERDIMEMDRAGNYYCRHVSAMTREALHSKSDIAAELGWRDMQIDQLKEHNEAIARQLEIVNGQIYSLCTKVDQLKVENWQLKEEAKWATEVTGELVKERDQLKAENERLKKEVRSWVIRIQQRGLEMDELSDERDALRTKLDEARELLNGIERGCLLSDDDAKIDAWLEANP